MKVILGLVKPCAGRVIYDNQEITAWSTPKIVRLGIRLSAGIVPISAQMTVRE